MLIPDENICPYISMDLEIEACLAGKVVTISPNIPEELREEAEKFANDVNKIVKENPFKEW